MRLASPDDIADILQLTNGNFEYGLAGWKQLDVQHVITGSETVQIYEEEPPYWLVLGLISSTKARRLGRWVCFSRSTSL